VSRQPPKHEGADPRAPAPAPLSGGVLRSQNPAERALMAERLLIAGFAEALVRFSNALHQIGQVPISVCAALAAAPTSVLVGPSAC